MGRIPIALADMPPSALSIPEAIPIARRIPGTPPASHSRTYSQRSPLHFRIPPDTSPHFANNSRRFHITEILPIALPDIPPSALGIPEAIPNALRIPEAIYNALRLISECLQTRLRTP